MSNCAQEGDTLSPEIFLIAPTEALSYLIPAYVYVVQWGEEGPVKIGQTAAPQQRLLELQCSNWMELRLVAAVPVMDVGRGFALEQATHRAARDYRIRGEWFDLHPLEAVECILAAAKHLNVPVEPMAPIAARLQAEAKAELHLQLDEEDAERRRKMRVRLGID